jgi:hypothetical protein
MISAPFNPMSVARSPRPSKARADIWSALCSHVLHASDADLAKEYLISCSVEGVGKIPGDIGFACETPFAQP